MNCQKVVRPFLFEHPHCSSLFSFLCRPGPHLLDLFFISTQLGVKLLDLVIYRFASPSDLDDRKAESRIRHSRALIRRYNVHLYDYASAATQSAITTISPSHSRPNTRDGKRPSSARTPTQRYEQQQQQLTFDSEE